WDAADIVAPYLALAYAVGRVGCFLNGCCYGRPTTLPLGVVFPSVDSLPRHPTQLYSVLAGLILYMVLRRLLRARRFEGQVILAYLGGYSLLRIAIEFFRENLVVWHGLTMAQVTALAVLLAVAPLYAWRKDHPPPVEPAMGKEGEPSE
ncbi:MAG: prolipoprotein diacylglyceryl transferase, partial [Syntrophomonadaceae bacterium]|nr:prolipoprotein diacylglyceryl transferase [Syntrophomonadaceae bacterium]